MAVTAVRPLTRHEYEKLPETGKRYQLMGGLLRMAPAPNRYHQEISRNLEFILWQHIKAHRLGEIYNAPFDVYLSDHDVFQPDLLFVSNERRSILSPKGVEGAPDLVIEILSPTSEFHDRNTKQSTYAEAGVSEYWLIEPKTQSIEVYLLGVDPDKPRLTVQLGKDAVMMSELFPGLEIVLAEVFGEV